MTFVAGSDVSKGKWVIIVLEDGRFSHALIKKTLPEVLDAVADVTVLAVDIPIGMPEGKEHRACDIAARKFVGPRSSSVFNTPPRSVLEAPDYQEGNQLSWRIFERGVSAQAYALGTKILEVDSAISGDDRIVEVHPEVCFCAIKGEPLDYSKHSWNGQAERRQLIAGVDIDLPYAIPDAGKVPPDDILDAAAAAWTAWRISQRKAKVLPESDTGCDQAQRGVIWY